MNKEQETRIKEFLRKGIESFEESLEETSKNRMMFEMLLEVTNTQGLKEQKIKDIKQDIQTLKEIYLILFGCEYARKAS